MRTTLSIDNDTLEAARKLAAVRKQPLGRVATKIAPSGVAGLDRRVTAAGALRLG